VSPGYGFLLILIAVLILGMDWRMTALTGVVAELGPTVENKQSSGLQSRRRAGAPGTTMVEVSQWARN
jgi:hypothetical protein